MRTFDIEAVAQSSKLGDVEALAAYVAANVDTPTKKMSRATGVTPDTLARLMSTKDFRERVTEYLTYAELSPDRERRILKRMIDVATDANSEFKEFREAATWVYRQGGMLKGDKAQVDVGGTIRVSFGLDLASDSSATEILDSYVPPDPLAGVIGLPGSAASFEEDEGVVDAEFSSAGGSEEAEEERGYEESGV